MVNTRLEHLRIYLLGPAAGALVAVATTVLLHGTNATDGDADRETEEAAQGDDPEPREPGH